MATNVMGRVGGADDDDDDDGGGGGGGGGGSSDGSAGKDGRAAGWIPGKTFDELYEQVCAELRQGGKSMDLCERIKAVRSDLNRVQLLLSQCPDVVSKFTNSIQDHYEGKREGEARKLLSLAKSLQSPGEAIETLTQALLVSPWRDSAKCGRDEVNEFAQSRAVSAESVEWLVRKLVRCSDGAGREETNGGSSGGESLTVEPTVPPTTPPCLLLAHIYLERAERLSQQHEHELALLDVLRALLCGLDGGRGSVGFTTARAIGVSLQALNYAEAATKVYLHALQLLRNDPQMDNAGKSKETMTVVKALKDMKANGKDVRAGGVGSVEVKSLGLDVFGGPNDVMTTASSALELRYDPIRGRHAVAKTSIPPGVTLIVDPPYAWSLYPDMYKRFCQHCCLPISAGIPCQRCSSVVYCKWECWERGEHYHGFECPILKNLDSSRILGEMGLLCFRTVCKTDPQLVQEYVAQLEMMMTTTTTSTGVGDGSEMIRPEMVIPSEHRLCLGLGEDGRLNPSSLPAVAAMTPNSEERPSGDMIKRTMAAIYLTLSLRHGGYLQHPHDHHESGQPRQTADEPGEEPIIIETAMAGDEEERRDGVGLSEADCCIAAFILRISQSLSCNAYGINSVVGHHNGMVRLHAIQQFGGACYPTISVINHSCNPNAFRFTWGNTCIVRTIRGIAEGEEIFDSYGPLFTTMAREERREVLKSQYFFTCHCRACEEDWPMYKELKATQPGQVGQLRVDKCPACLASDRGRVDGANRRRGGGEGSHPGARRKQCVHCGEKMDGKRMVQSLGKSEQRYLSAKEDLLSHKPGLLPDGVSRAVLEHLGRLEKLLPPPHRLIIECQEALKLAWNLLAYKLDTLAQ